MTLVVINQKFRAVGPAAADRPPTEAVLKTAEMFGIGLDESYEVTLYDRVPLDVRPGDVVLVTGPSGCGKSVLLARLAEALAAAWPGAAQVDLAAVALPPDRPVIDLMRPPLERALRVLSAAGLADAFLLLRTPPELSDGQRYRLRLALAVDQCGVLNAECGTDGAKRGTRNPERGTSQQGDGALLSAASSGLQVPSSPSCAPGSEFRVPGSPFSNPPSATRHSQPSVLVADEFCSTLDRLCARAVAYRVRRMASREGVTVLAASAHEDLLEDLAPDVLVVKHEARQVEILYADPSRPEDRP
jgi:ABC-type ATPase with predicted acetyltransferase domain